MSIEITSWKRYGKHRIYLHNCGTELGWFDALTGNWNTDGDMSFAQAWSCLEGTPWHEIVGKAYQEQQFSPRQEESSISEKCSAEVEEVLSGEGKDCYRNLAENKPGDSLQAKVAQAHEQGQRPTFIRRLFLGKDAYSSWEKGVRGEEAVAKSLEKLLRKAEGWYVLHSVPVGAGESDIDHIAIGPAGVFTINSKYHPKGHIWLGGNTLMVNGARQPYVHNSRFEASRAQKLLLAATGIQVPVTGLIVIVEAETWKIKEQPEDVVVLSDIQLRRWLTKQQGCLPPDLVKKIYTTACDSRIWRT